MLRSTFRSTFRSMLRSMFRCASTSGSPAFRSASRSGSSLRRWPSTSSVSGSLVVSNRSFLLLGHGSSFRWPPVRISDPLDGPRHGIFPSLAEKMQFSPGAGAALRVPERFRGGLPQPQSAPRRAGLGRSRRPENGCTSSRWPCSRTRREGRAPSASWCSFASSRPRLSRRSLPFSPIASAASA